MTWQTIDTAPKDGTYVLVYRPNWAEAILVGYSGPNYPGEWQTAEGIPIRPTHWMPLPEPPK